MGTIYCGDILQVEDPQVGLLNVGEEPEKGTDLLKEAYQVLESLPNFAGNVEGRDIFAGKADVFVCDGFTGNVLLKFGESIPATLRTMVGETMNRMNLEQPVRESVIRVFEETLYSFNYEHVGGVPFLGVNGISMVGHGGSSPMAIKNMILHAARCVETNVNQKIVDSLHH
jgi:phosphate acyltransferase